MKRIAIWSAALALVAALGAAVFSFWIKPRALLEERQRGQDMRRRIEAHPFVRARTDSGYMLVVGPRCAPLVPDTSGAVEFCLEKKTGPDEVLQYTFERYQYDSRDSSACRISPRTENGWECGP
jgi:hypothetical protein